METISLETAKELFKSENLELSKLALESHSIYELMDLEDLDSIEEVCKVLGYDSNKITKKFDAIWPIDATAAYMYLLGTIRDGVIARSRRGIWRGISRCIYMGIIKIFSKKKITNKQASPPSGGRG